MKVCQQKIDALKMTRRVNENVRGTCLRDEFSMFALGRFQHTDYGGSNRDDPECTVDLICGFWRNRKALGMHAMLCDFFRSDRQKCSGSHMQGYEGVRNLAQDLRRKMKTSSGRCERTRCLRENSLVTRPILSVAFASNVRRQRHRTTGMKIDIVA